MGSGEHREMFAEAQAIDDNGLPWVPAGEVGWTREGLRRQNGPEVGKGQGEGMERRCFSCRGNPRKEQFDGGDNGFGQDKLSAPCLRARAGQRAVAEEKGVL